ncbi:hypothetical protein PC111_g21341 [Phytophthora cactorum]|uniref:Uncharacterized protein n=1 Tax=Phytophthora cactorum TaxID=29920 RepID=A0A8T1ALN9_9STRA|nr:hypothetical protein PC111_g21341 [Phytophthora cactorum]KAG2798546.1 hypothetical protein PC112_g21304 [Phytophthora cactorum]KAG2885502.1 hypothetical protein PC115_g20997 [Phytophthora cactorum]
MTQSQNYHRYFFNIDNKYRTQRTSLDQNYSKRFRSHSAELDGGTKISQGHEASAFTRRSSHGQYGLLVNVYYVYTKDFRKLSRLMKQIFQCRTPFMRENGLDILGKSSKFYLLSTKLEIVVYVGSKTGCRCFVFSTVPKYALHLFNRSSSCCDGVVSFISEENILRMRCCREVLD